METVKGRDRLIIFVMVDDILVEDLPPVMKTYVNTRTYIDARDINNQKDLDLFRKKLQYAMPQTPLRDVPQDEADPAEVNPNLPPNFNRLNRREEVQLPDAGEAREEEGVIAEQEAVL